MVAATVEARQFAEAMEQFSALGATVVPVGNDTEPARLGLVLLDREVPRTGGEVTALVIGTGKVTSSPAGINCGANCSGNFPRDSVVTLTATAQGGDLFNGWSGGGCTVR